MASFVAVDLGASSGRVVMGDIQRGRITTKELARFPNEAVTLPGEGLCWNICSLYRRILDGLRSAARFAAAPRSIGIDSWGVDYGLVDDSGALLGEIRHYRNERTKDSRDAVAAIVPDDALYQRTGIPALPFNTIYQLMSDGAAGRTHEAAQFLLIADLIGFWLTGQGVAEVTNASTTGMLDTRSGQWDLDLVETIGLPPTIFPTIVQPGHRRALRRCVADDVGLSESTILTSVASHDTASAIAAIPATHDRFAYISCGTWALVGVELETPLLTEASRASGFSNEHGVGGRICFHRNVMGLWLLQQCIDAWVRAGHLCDLEQLIAAARQEPRGGPVVDLDLPEFARPGDMPEKIRSACVVGGQKPPTNRAALVRCIMDSLAAAFAHAISDAIGLASRSIDVIHLIGGGARNSLLCQLTADACEIPVIAGPAEASTLGNLLVQANADLDALSDIGVARQFIRRNSTLQRFTPRFSLS